VAWGDRATGTGAELLRPPPGGRNTPVLAPDMCAISAAARLPPGTFASPPPVVPHASLSFVPHLHLPGRLQSTLTPPVCTSSGPCCATVHSLPRWRCGCLRIDRVPGVLDKDIDWAALGGTRTRWVASSAYLACPSPLHHQDQGSPLHRAAILRTVWRPRVPLFNTRGSRPPLACPYARQAALLLQVLGLCVHLPHQLSLSAPSGAVLTPQPTTVATQAPHWRPAFVMRDCRTTRLLP